MLLRAKKKRRERFFGGVLLTAVGGSGRERKRGRAFAKVAMAFLGVDHEQEEGEEAREASPP